jgi:hypothetical protein
MNMFPNLNSAEVSNTNKLGAGVHLVTIKSYEDKKSMKGLPYKEFLCQSPDGVAYIRFNGITKDTSAAASKVRTEMFKKFLITAGATNFSSEAMACNSILNKQVKLILTERQYWTTDDTGVPVIRTYIDYKMSGTPDSNLTFDASLNRPLSGDDLEQYMAAKNAYNNAINSHSPTVAKEDDLPF